MTKLKGNLDRHPGPPRKLDTEQYKYWMKHKNLKRHKFETPLMKIAIQKKLKMGYSPEDLFKVINNYSKLIEVGQAPGYNDWGLTELMRNRVFFDNLLDDDWQGFNGKDTRLAEDVGLLQQGWTEE